MVEEEIRPYINKDKSLQKQIDNIGQVKELSLITIISVISKKQNGFASIANTRHKLLRPLI